MNDKPQRTESAEDSERAPSPEAAEEVRAERERTLAAHVRSVRLGHGANCSSIGSVVDTLFASAVVTGAIFAAVCAALATEKVTVVGAAPERAEPDGATASEDPEESDRPDV